MAKSLAPIMERANITYRMRAIRELILSFETHPSSIERDVQLEALKYELDTLKHQFIFLLIENVPKH